MSRAVPIQDVICLVVPASYDLGDMGTLGKVRDELSRLAEATVFLQYGGDPPIIEAITTEWLITCELGEVESFQPAHDCAKCRDGNLMATAFLALHPDRYVALGNISYTEVWP